MKRIPFLFSLILFLLYKFISYKTGEVWLPMLVFVLPVLFLILNFAFRKSLIYKNWFLSSLNIFLEKKTYQVTEEISSDLLFEKLLEVIADSEFQLYDTDKRKLNILCGTSANFWTWGENIYIDLTANEKGETTVKFVSLTLFGNTSWSRNKQNYESFIHSYEESLTI